MLNLGPPHPKPSNEITNVLIPVFSTFSFMYFKASSDILTDTIYTTYTKVVNHLDLLYSL